MPTGFARRHAPARFRTQEKGTALEVTRAVPRQQVIVALVPEFSELTQSCPVRRCRPHLPWLYVITQPKKGQYSCVSSLKIADAAAENE